MLCYWRYYINSTVYLLKFSPGFKSSSYAFSERLIIEMLRYWRYYINSSVYLQKFSPGIKSSFRWKIWPGSHNTGVKGHAIKSIWIGLPFTRHEIEKLSWLLSWIVTNAAHVRVFLAAFTWQSHAWEIRASCIRPAGAKKIKLLCWIAPRHATHKQHRQK